MSNVHHHIAVWRRMEGELLDQYTPERLAKFIAESAFLVGWLQGLVGPEEIEFSDAKPADNTDNQEDRE